VRRTVVLHPGALGDVLLSVPALRALRGDASGGELVLAAQPRIGRMLAALGVVDRHVAFDTLGIQSLFVDDVPSERLAGLVAGARVVSWFGHADAGFGRRLRALAPGAIVASTTPAGDGAVWQHLAASVASATDDAWRDDLSVPPAMVDEGRRVLSAAGWIGARPLVVLHPGAGGAPKRWPAEGFADVAEALVRVLGAEVVVHDGPADHDAVAAVRSRMRESTIHLVEPALEALAGATRHASLWLGNDSGVTHLAAAVGVPTLALFRAPNLRWRPWARHARVQVVSMDALTRADIDAILAGAGSSLDLASPGRTLAPGERR
jgi:ADP-heptose:LPS heptosyltransferase